MATSRQLRRAPVLVCIGGLPATGKTTIARELSVELRAAYVRIDTIEIAIDNAESRFGQTNKWHVPPGYLVGYDVAVDQLRNGLDVIAESVNPLQVTRDAWCDAARRANAGLVEVEVVCSDQHEHRSRAEQRVLDIAGLTNPTWEQITNREYEAWERDRVVVDTIVLSVKESVRRICRAVDGLNA